MKTLRAALVGVTPVRGAPAASARSTAGFSLIELMLVVGVTGIVMAIAVLQAGVSRSALKGDGAMRVVLGQLRTARELAITQRRYMRITFTSPSQVTIEREEVPGPAITPITSTPLEGGVQFLLTAGAPDTSDAFGNNAAVDFGNVTNVKFSPDGTLVNQSGETVNGTVFLSLPLTELSARAITLQGATGRVRGYRWDGRQWNAAS